VGVNGSNDGSESAINDTIEFFRAPMARAILGIPHQADQLFGHRCETGNIDKHSNATALLLLTGRESFALGQLMSDMRRYERGNSPNDMR
jgi:hypothetical protein